MVRALDLAIAPLNMGSSLRVSPSWTDSVSVCWFSVVAVVPGRDSSIVLLLQFVPQCEEGGVEFDAVVERVWAGKPCLMHES